MPIKKFNVNSITAGSITSAAIEPTVLTSITPKITGITITDNSYVAVDDTAVGVGGGYIIITGTGFASGCSVLIGSLVATSVSFVNSTTVRAQVPAQAAGSYTVYLSNLDGGVAIRINGLNYSSTPAWSTTSPLPGGVINSAISIQLSATSNSTVTYALQAGSTLPAGLTLSNVGLLSGTVSGLTVETTYNFTVVATDAELQDTPQAFSITITASDTNFKNVTTLLSASNPTSTFVTDASTNNFAVTVNGDARPNNFNPYTPGYYSAFFDGTGDYLSSTITSTTIGTGNFTVECWVYPTAAYGNLSRMFLFGPGAGIGYLTFYITSSGQVIYGPSGTALITTTSTVPLNTWTHIAVSRSSGTTNVYLNGVSGGSAADSTNFPAATTFFLGQDGSGNHFTGYISNFRLVNGSAVYTSAFTLPTTPLTTVTNTALLLCQSNRFIDNSTNNFAITRFGDTSISGFDPFAPNSSYSSYGSGYFDGTGDYLTVAAASGIDISTGDFTIEAFVYPTVKTNSVDSVFGYGTFSIMMYHNGTTWSVEIGNGSSNYFTLTGTCTLNVWQHLAITRSGNTFTFWVNGVSAGTNSTSSAVATSSRNLQIGWNSVSTQFFTGYISNFRMVKGTAVYTSAFTPPTAPLTAITNTQLLTLQNNQPNNNNMFLDSSTNNFLITRNGNTTQGSFSPYGGGWSNYFDGNGDYLTAPANSNWDWATSAFTIEMWVYNITNTGYPLRTTQAIQVLNSTATADDANWSFGTNASGVTTFFYWNGSAQFVTGATTIPLRTWTHLAFTYDGSSAMRIYVNGVLDASGTRTGTPQALSKTLSIGAGNSGYYNGYISNVRIVKGTAVYTAAFTPPTAPLTPIANTSLLTCADNRFVDDSANNFTITKNGDVSVQRFSPFHPVLTTPIGYSGYFDGTGDWLQIANSTNLDLPGDFTVEAWIYCMSTANRAHIITGKWDTAYAWAVSVNPSTGAITFSYGNSGTYVAGVDFGNTFTANSWFHVAVTRSSSTVRVFLNGTQVGTNQTITSNLTATATTWVGRDDATTRNFIGYISNVRVVKGTAVYTSNFTPSTTPLTAIANTNLLTLQNATFVDNSTNNFTITASGNSQPTQFNPFGWTSTTGSSAAYSAANYSGSMYLDGNEDYLTAPSNTAFQFGTGAFTIEAWVYTTKSSGVQNIWSQRNASGNGITFRLESNRTLQFFYDDVGSGIITTTTTIPTNSWAHVAITKLSNTITLWINGVSSASGSNSVDVGSTTTPFIGRSGVDSSESFQGYISNVRAVKGRALYTSNFAPPAAPLSFDASAVLQLNSTGAAIYDSAMIATYETLGNASSTTVIKKYGNSSMSFDGTGDYLKAPWSPTYSLPGDFTVEAWVYLTSAAGTGSNQTIASYQYNNSNGTGFWGFYLNGSGPYTLYFNTQGANHASTTTVSIPLSTWTHVAYSRSGATGRFFVNGTIVGTGVSDTSTYSGTTGSLFVGIMADASSAPLYGYLDDLRITNGVARYTTTFTPPATPFIAL